MSYIFSLCQASLHYLIRTDPILEPMLQAIPDPFDSYGSHSSENRIFSVLQPLALLHEDSPSTTSLTSNATSRIYAARKLDEVEDSVQDNPSTSSESPRSAFRYPAPVGLVPGPESTENGQDYEPEIREQGSTLSLVILSFNYIEFQNLKTTIYPPLNHSRPLER